MDSIPNECSDINAILLNSPFGPNSQWSDTEKNYLVPGKGLVSFGEFMDYVTDPSSKLTTDEKNYRLGVLFFPLHAVDPQDVYSLGKLITLLNQDSPSEFMRDENIQVLASGIIAFQKSKLSIQGFTEEKISNLVTKMHAEMGDKIDSMRVFVNKYLPTITDIVNLQETVKSCQREIGDTARKERKKIEKILDELNKARRERNGLLEV